MEFNDIELNKLFKHVTGRTGSVELDPTISTYFSDKCVLVIGGAGSIGQNISKLIASFPVKKLIVLDQSETPLHNLELNIKSNSLKNHVDFVLADIKQEEILKLIFEQNEIDTVYHVAAYKHVQIVEKNPLQAILTNVLGTKIIADLCVDFEVEKFVFISSDKAIKPTSVMGASKRMAELYIQALQRLNPDKTSFSIVRFGNVFGSDGSVIPLFIKQIKENNIITITDPSAERYFISIHEACSLILNTTLIGQKGNIYMHNLIEKTKMIEVAKRVIECYNLIPEKDVKMSIIGLREGEKLSEEYFTDNKEIITTNEKIVYIQNNLKDSTLVKKTIDEFLENAVKYGSHQLISKMKAIIPEYKSNNSEYEILD